MIPVCRELSTPVGGIDVLYVTPQGRLAVVEAKLWRNPEARRKVVGQILDYAKELAQWRYERLDAAVKLARRRGGAAGGLVEAVSASVPEADQARFVDGVSRSLRRGDLLLLIVGDGIREGVGAITEFLEKHGTLHFTFGLIEMAIYRAPGGGHFVQPRVLAQSSIVRRIVVSADAGLSVADEPGVGDVAVESEVDPALAETRRYFTEFWTEFLAGWQLDDQSQPVPGPSRSPNLYFYMPSGSKGWVSAYVAKSSRRIGVYLTFERGTIAQRLFEGLKGEKNTIESELGVPVLWQDDGDGKYMIVARKSVADVTAPQHRATIIAWLRETANQFINVFRPRIERLLKEI